MAELRLGPLLRYADGSSATVWIEASRPCSAEVRCADGSGGTTRTFRVAGHHYALIPVTGLTPGTTTPYEVFLDGTRVWPLPDSRFPPSAIRTPAGDADVTVAFGSCRWASPPTGEHDPVGPDALDGLAERIAADPDGERPDVLLLLGDQVYA
ncbi:alkaline phosphatase family protein, partial [Streptomyces sp. NPDC057052]